MASVQSGDVKNKTCQRCSIYVSEPELGHSSCSAHRKCSGSKGWVPDRCDACVEFISNFDSWDEDQQLANMLNLKSMLIRTVHNRPKKGWLYRDKLKSKFPNFNRFQELPASRSVTPAIDEISQSSVHELGGNIHSAEMYAGNTLLGSQQQHPPFHTPADDSLAYSHGNAAFVSVNDAAPPAQHIVQENHMDSPLNQDLVSTLRASFAEFTNTVSDRFDKLLKKQDVVIANNSEHQSRLEKFLNDHPRTPRSRRGSFSSCSQYASCSSRGSPDPSWVHDPTSPSEEWFQEDGHTWLWVSDDTKFSGTLVNLKGTLTPYIKHPIKNAFRTVPHPPQTESPFMSTNQAYDTLASFLHARKESTDKLGPQGRSFRLHLDDASDMNHALRLLQGCSPTVVWNLYSGGPKKIDSDFPASAFDPVSFVHYSSGWTLTSDSDFSKFAKAETLDLHATARNLRLPYHIHVPNKYLLEEKTTRLRLLDYISGLGMLDSIIRSIDSNTPLVDALKATARHQVSFLKEFALTWFRAKYILRQIVLQYSDAPIASNLLTSDMWQSNLFSSEAVTSFCNSDHRDEGNVFRLGLSERTNENYKKHPRLASPSKNIKQYASTSNKGRSDQSSVFLWKTI